jgi:hypothetical protein
MESVALGVPVRAMEPVKGRETSGYLKDPDMTTWFFKKVIGG